MSTSTQALRVARDRERAELRALIARKRKNANRGEDHSPADGDGGGPDTGRPDGGSGNGSDDHGGGGGNEARKEDVHERNTRSDWAAMPSTTPPNRAKRAALVVVSAPTPRRRVHGPNGTPNTHVKGDWEQATGTRRRKRAGNGGEIRGGEAEERPWEAKLQSASRCGVFIYRSHQ